MNNSLWTWVNILCVCVQCFNFKCLIVLFYILFRLRDKTNVNVGHFTVVQMKPLKVCARRKVNRFRIFIQHACISCACIFFFIRLVSLRRSLYIPKYRFLFNLICNGYYVSCHFSSVCRQVNRNECMRWQMNFSSSRDRYQIAQNLMCWIRHYTFPRHNFVSDFSF